MLTAVMSWSYVESRVNSSKLEAIAKPPGTALNRVFMFNTKTRTIERTLQGSQIIGQVRQQNTKSAFKVGCERL